MKMKILSILAIAILAISSIGMSSATLLTVNARSQDNDGLGWIQFYNASGNVYKINSISPGESKTYDTSTLDKASTIRFHSDGRMSGYDAKLAYMDSYSMAYPNGHVVVNVNFYNKGISSICYNNIFYLEDRAGLPIYYWHPNGNSYDKYDGGQLTDGKFRFNFWSVDYSPSGGKG